MGGDTGSSIGKQEEVEEEATALGTRRLSIRYMSTHTDSFGSLWESRFHGGYGARTLQQDGPHLTKFGKRNGLGTQGTSVHDIGRHDVRVC